MGNFDDAYMSYQQDIAEPPPQPPLIDPAVDNVEQPALAPAPEPTAAREIPPIPDPRLGPTDLSQPSLTNYDPTLREQGRAWTQDTLVNIMGVDLGTAQRFSENLWGNEHSNNGTLGIGLGDFLMVPGVQEGIRQFQRGYNTGSNADMAIGGLIAASEALPLAGTVMKAATSQPVLDFLGTALKRYDAGQSPLPASGRQATGGVPFAPEVSANNLRLHQNRLLKFEETGTPYPGGPKNERTVIPAPAGSGLPDFALGKITPDDWVVRTEQLMTPQEIQASAKWYDEVYGGFLAKTGGDQEQSSKLMGAWLAAQQNESPANAMTNVLFMQEQLNRGVPLNQIQGKGLPSANSAALSVLTGEDIKKGVGQKISDFIDAGEGRDVRSIMGNDPAGGRPFVVDIHTGRDTGLVDQKLVNHLTRLGYDVPDSVIIDLGAGGIKGPMYENRAIFGRQLTDHLNEIGWQGKNDWKPREVQAIGWMGLTRMYGTNNMGGDVASSFGRNTRRVSMEAAPGAGSPADIKYGQRFGALPFEQQRDITTQLTNSAIDKVSAKTGINLGNVVHATGGWMDTTNASTVQQAISSKEGAIEAGRHLGVMLQQEEVWVNSVKGMTKNPKGYAMDFIEDGSTKLRDNETLMEFWSRVQAADDSGLIGGFQPIEDAAGNVGIRVLVKKGGKGARAAVDNISNKLDDIVSDLDYNIGLDISEAEITILKNNWKEAPDGSGYFSKGNNERQGLASDQGRSSLNSDRQELEDFFGSLIDAAEGASQ